MNTLADIAAFRSWLLYLWHSDQNAGFERQRSAPEQRVRAVSFSEVDASLTLRFSRELTENKGEPMRPLYAARIEDLGAGDLLKVDCGGCSHTALLSAEFLSHRLGLDGRLKVLDLKDKVRCRQCGARGRAVVSIRWAPS